MLNDDGAFQTCVRSNLANRLLKSLQNDGSAGLLVAVNGIDIGLNSRNRIDECGAAACDDAFFNSSLRCGQSVLNAHLLLFHLDLGSRTDLDNRYAAGELCQTLLQLLTVEIGRGGLDLASDLADTALDSLAVACTVNNDGVFLVDLDLTCTAELINRWYPSAQGQARSEMTSTAGQDCNIREHFFSSVAEARSLDAHAGERAAQLVENQGGQRLALNVLSDDDELLAGLYDLLKQRQNLLNVGDLLIGDEDVRDRR